jgi:hypothetical protein
MITMRIASVWAVLSALVPSRALLTVVSPSEYAGRTLKTANYVYYGPQSTNFTLNAVYMKGDHICDHKEPIDKDVEGKIIVVRRGGTYCLMDQQYSELRARGRQAQTAASLFTRGLFSALARTSWLSLARHCRHCGGGLRAALGPAGVPHLLARVLAHV